MTESEKLSLLLKQLNDPNSSVRFHALDSLRTTQNNEAINSVVDTLKSDVHEHLRAHAAEVLGEIGDEYAVDALGQSLQAETGKITRSFIVEALGKIGGEKSIQILTSCIQNEKDDDVLGVCIQQLGRFRLEYLAEVFMSFLSHPNQGVVCAAIVALLDLEYPPALDGYRKLLRDPRSFVHVSAITCLRILGLKLNINIKNDLEALLDDDRHSIRNTAKQMLWLYEKEVKERS